MVDLIQAAESTLEDLLGLDSATSTLPEADFTASLDYIDSLASRSSVSLNRRDIANITTAASTFDYLSPLLESKAVPGPIEQSFAESTDRRPLQDRRTFAPQGARSKPFATIKSASQVVSPSYPQSRIATPQHPYTPEEIQEIIESPGYKKSRRSPFAFKQPSNVEICLKRKIRKKMMHIFGFAGMAPRLFRHPRRSYWSRVVC